MCMRIRGRPSDIIASRGGGEIGTVIVGKLRGDADFLERGSHFGYSVEVLESLVRAWPFAECPEVWQYIPRDATPLV
jgi:hypothetical protein